MRGTIFIIVILLMPIYAWAVFDDGSSLLTACSVKVRIDDGERNISEDEALKGLMCMEYILGFIDSHTTESIFTEKKQYCLPDNGIRMQQAARIVVKFLKANPKFLQEKARLGTFAAFHESILCHIRFSHCQCQNQPPT